MLLENADLKTIEKGVNDLNVGEGETIMVLLAEESANNIEALINFFNQQGISFFGGLFPGLVYGTERLEQGCILKKFKTAATPFLVKNLSDKTLEGINRIILPATDEKMTIIILLDGLTSNINHFLESLNNIIGDKVNFIGGGAGSGSLQQQLCLFNNDGFFMDAAICCVIENKSNLGVRHGWKKLAGPLVATASEGPRIIQLNWQNAFEVYKSYMESDNGKTVTKENFLEHTKDYPFGIFRENADEIVRDPIGVNAQGDVTCIGEVPANTVLHILKSSSEMLIEAASDAMKECKSNATEPFNPENTFVVDCITRPSALGDRFSEELQAIRNQLDVQQPEQEPFGILSLGEISSYGDGLLEFFNKTIVVGTFHAD
ncbi:MAG: FIST C-terminal domain-containing protein [Bacteroidota bacterium]